MFRSSCWVWQGAVLWHKTLNYHLRHQNPISGLRSGCSTLAIPANVSRSAWVKCMGFCNPIERLNWSSWPLAWIRSRFRCCSYPESEPIDQRSVSSLSLILLSLSRPLYFIQSLEWINTSLTIGKNHHVEMLPHSYQLFPGPCCWLHSKPLLIIIVTISSSWHLRSVMFWSPDDILHVTLQWDGSCPLLGALQTALCPRH